jgi:hypothetical protein
MQKDYTYEYLFEEAVGRVKKISIFDFDGTLFASPQKPDWWPMHGFWSKIQTLSPPYVPEYPTGNWWSAVNVPAARREIGRDDVHTVMMTGRLKNFETRIKDMLDSVDLKFDEYHFCPGGDTLKFKLSVLEGLLQKYTTIDFVEMWEDRPEHVIPFEEKLERLEIPKFKVNLVERETREFDVNEYVG